MVDKKTPTVTDGKTPAIIPVSGWSNYAPRLWPFTTSAADHLVKSFERELVKAGALTRIGRERLIRTKLYKAWLFSKTIVRALKVICAARPAGTAHA